MLCLSSAASFWNVCGPHVTAVARVTLGCLPGRMSTVRCDLPTIGGSEYSLGRVGDRVGSRDTERGTKGGSKRHELVSRNPSENGSNRTVGRSRGKEPTKKRGVCFPFRVPAQTNGRWVDLCRGGVGPSGPSVRGPTCTAEDRKSEGRGKGRGAPLRGMQDDVRKSRRKRTVGG